MVMDWRVSGGKPFGCSPIVCLMHHRTTCPSPFEAPCMALECLVLIPRGMPTITLLFNYMA